MTSFTKPEVQNVSQRHQRRTQPRPQATYENSVSSADSEPGIGRTLVEASKEDQGMGDRQSFPIGLIDSMVVEISRSRESRPLAPAKEIRSRGF